MATYPGGIVALSNPSTADKMNIVPHAAQHANANDEIEAIETALGVNLANVVQTGALDTDGTLSANSDVKVATQKAVKTYADAMVLSGGGIPLGYLDTDGTLAGNSDIKVPTQKAVKTYVDTEISGISVLTTLEFDNGDLTTGVLTITGDKTIVEIRNNSGVVIHPDDIDEVGGNTEIDFTSYGTLSGTWKVKYL